MCRKHSGRSHPAGESERCLYVDLYRSPEDRCIADWNPREEYPRVLAPANASKTMRAIDDPRVAAELFCDQHGITDGKIVGHLEETLRDLIYPRPSPESSMGNRAQPSFHPTSEPRPSPSPSLPQPTSPPINGRASAGVSPRPAVEAHNTDVRRENAAVGRLTTSWTTGIHGRDERNGHGPHGRAAAAAEVTGVRTEAAAGAAAESAAEEGEPKTPSAGVNVMEVARAMREDAAMASMDAADPGLVVVDLVVNGVPAPLVFRDPRRKLAARRNRDDHGHPGCDREKTQTLGKQGGSAGGDGLGGAGLIGARRDRRFPESNGKDHGGQGGDVGEKSNAGVDGDEDKEGARMGASRTEGADGGVENDEEGGGASSRSDGTCHGRSDDNDNRSDGSEVDQGQCDRTGEGAGDSISSRRCGHGADDEGGGETPEKTPRTRPEVEGEGQDVEEDRERAIAAAAVAWCRRFGSARVEDISFVRAEIRKAVAAREKAAAGKVDPGAAAAAAGGGTGKDAAAAPTPAEGNDAPSSKGRTGDGHPKYVVASKPYLTGGGTRDATPRAEAAEGRDTRGKGDTEWYGGDDGDGRKGTLWGYDGEHREGDNSRSRSGSHSGSGSSSSSDGSSGRGGGGKASGRRRKEGEKGGAAGGHGEHVTISSVLAPDVVKGTSIFWVQVEPGLPVVYVLAGYSALEISQQFCRSHKLGPSQVPLVAWKLLEAYPVQMEAARRDGTPLPAKVTLEYATCQPEAQKSTNDRPHISFSQAAALVVAAGLLLLLFRRRAQRRGSRWSSRGRTAPGRTARGYLQRRNQDADTATKFSAFRGWLFLWWRWTKLQAEDQRESMEDTTVVSSPAPGGDSGARLAPKSRGVGDLFSPSSVMRRLFGRAKGTATAEQAAEGHAGKARQDPPAAASSRTNRKPVDNENTVGPLEGRTTPVAESAATHAAAPAPLDDASSSSSSSSTGRRKGGGDGNKTTLRGGPPALSRLRSWADAFSFECGRLVGAAVRKAVVLPLMRVFGGGAERNAGDETTSAAAAIAASPWPRKRKQSASTARARSRKGRGSFHGGLGVSSNRSEPAKKPQSGASKGPGDCSTPRAAENEETRGRYERESSGRGEGRAPFSAGRSDQRGSNGDASEGRGGDEGVPATVAAATGGKSSSSGGGGGSSSEVPQRTWASVLDGLARDPLNRFSEVALLSKVGHILAKTDAFAIEAHESCDWTRLFKSKKSDIIVGRQKFLVLSRNEGSIIVANKALGTKMIGRKTRAGTVVLGAYTDHSKSEAREGVAWLAEALASSRVR